MVCPMYLLQKDFEKGTQMDLIVVVHAVAGDCWSIHNRQEGYDVETQAKQ